MSGGARTDTALAQLERLESNMRAACAAWRERRWVPIQDVLIFADRLKIWCDAAAVLAGPAPPTFRDWLLAQVTEREGGLSDTDQMVGRVLRVVLNNLDGSIWAAGLAPSVGTTPLPATPQSDLIGHTLDCELNDSPECICGFAPATRPTPQEPSDIHEVVAIAVADAYDDGRFAIYKRLDGFSTWSRISEPFQSFRDAVDAAEKRAASLPQGDGLVLTDAVLYDVMWAARNTISGRPASETIAAMRAVLVAAAQTKETER